MGGFLVRLPGEAVRSLGLAHGSRDVIGSEDDACQPRKGMMIDFATGDSGGVAAFHKFAINPLEMSSGQLFWLSLLSDRTKPAPCKLVLCWSAWQYQQLLLR